MPHRRPIRVLPLVLAPLLVPVNFPAFLSPPARAGEARLSLSGGIHSPLGGDERERFGIAPQFGLGLATEFADGASMVGLDVGYVHSGGGERYISTFEFPESHYTLVPVTVSVTTRLAPESRESWPRVFVGFFVTVMPTWFTDRNEETFSTPTVGAGLELRPEFHLASDWRAFGRTRLLLVEPVDYQAALDDINYSALSLELGVSTGLH
ncbi:MAG TPA: hypothetical protein VF720_05855 [Candidatus Eisenbacteria bacterium]